MAQNIYRYFYGYMIPEPLYYETGITLGKPFSRAIRDDKTIPSREKSAARLVINLNILTQCEFNTVEDRVKCRAVLEDEDSSDDSKWWTMVVIAYKAPEWDSSEKDLNRNPVQFPQDRLKKLKELFGLEPDAEPVLHRERFHM
ncbi:hypothetical protein BJ138DRAFT_1109630 [Hygrophoropsis aurantiaca]|uniref:Uncharacterized protein n=1 Tax=Hygrophoropsis aurantiaca TaxID=72124 RepID=A0ACB8AQN5_9AGAM|nr:hypothetical protein BJ138DRAFT_1109630 [Hygrophoropsis aurantiaca]